MMKIRKRKKKLWNRFKSFIIRKLGGIAIDDIKGVTPDYWDRYYTSETLYISKDDYTKENAKSIEHELAERIGRDILRHDCLFLQTSSPDKHGDVTITAGVNVLRLHRRGPYHMPSHLRFKEE